MTNNKQSSVDKEFLPYEEALALKEIGFDKPCFGYWYTEEEDCKKVDVQISTVDFIGDEPDYILALTFSQSFRFFRDKDLNGEVYSQQRPKDNFMYAFRISGTDIIEDGFTSYEEAELACLKKLIEIVKEKKNEQQ